MTHEARLFLPDHPDRRFDAVICDIDGCLTPETTAPIDARALAQIADWNGRAKATGDRPIVTLCSGRPVTAVEMVSRFIANDRVPCVAEMGVWLFDPPSTGFEMDPAITDEHKQAVRDASRWVERELIPEGVLVQPGKHASISLWHADSDHLHETLIPRVQDITEAEAWPLHVSASWHWINWDLTHITKGTGIERFCAHTGFTKPRLAGIGDTSSDLAIREQVAFFACPANAKDDLKAHADLVSDLPEARGVLQILESLL